MASRKRKIPKDLSQDLTDEVATVLQSIEDSLPCTQALLKSKPHLTIEKKTDIEKCLKELRPYVQKLSANFLCTADKEEQDKLTKILFAVTCLLKSLLDFQDYSHSVTFRVIIHSMVSLLIDHPVNTVDVKLRNQISLLSLSFFEKADVDEHEICCVIVTFKYFLDVTLDNEAEKNSVRKIDIKHVWSLYKFIEGVNLFDPEFKDLCDKLLLTVANHNYVKYKEGQNIIASLMCRDVNLAKQIHKRIMSLASRISKNIAHGYGYVYFIAWTHSKDEVREEIQNCIQDLMKRVLGINRAGLEMPKAGTNGLAILSILHQSRRLKKFSDVLNTLYTPILWRQLRDSDHWKRCNAAQVFLDVFPLEIPYGAEPDNALYMDRQIKEIKDLLLDYSHFVRVIAIKGICVHLTNSFVLFSLSHIKGIMKILIEDLRNDGSTYLVRKAVFEGLEMMANGTQDADGHVTGSAAVLEPVLPLTYLSIHDENEKVRKAVVKLLLKIKERENVLKLRYWEIVPLQHLVSRLAIEGPVVGELIVKLIMNAFYTRGQETDKTINRLIRLLKWNSSAIKNLFHYSKNVLTVEEAFLLIVTLVGLIRKKLRHHLETETEFENENTKADNRRKKKRKGSLEDISNINLEKDKEPESETSTSSSPPARTHNEINVEFLENYKYIAGLINGASVLWVTFRNELAENEKYLDNLYSLACSAIPMFLKHYRGTCVYYATVSFASLIPISKLKGVSTVSSACISELKEVTEETDISKIQCLIYSLCSWFRGHDVLDLASEWLNYAFREQNLNNSAIPVKPGQRAPKVRFQPVEGKPMLSLKLLDVLFSDVLNESRLVCKNYEQLYEFYCCLERVVIIIERKVTGADGFNNPGSQLTDEFLSRAYARYLRMMHTLHRPEPPSEATDTIKPFSAPAVLKQAILWACRTLYQHIPSEGSTGAPPLAARCCISVLKESTLAIALTTVDQDYCKAVALFATDLLSIDCVWFLEEALNTIKVISDYAEDDTPNDEWQLLKVILPSLLEKALAVISNLDVSVGTAKTYFKDLIALKQSLFAFPKTILALYGAKDELFISVFRKFIHTCILMAMDVINKEDEFIPCKTFGEQPYFVEIILKFIIQKPRFIIHLLPSLLHFINTYSQEGYKLISCFSILYTLICSARSRFDSVELESVLQDSYQVLKNYEVKEKLKPVDLDESSFFSSTSLNIDIKKVGESIFEELGKVLNCSLVK